MGSPFRHCIDHRLDLRRRDPRKHTCIYDPQPLNTKHFQVRVHDPFCSADSHPSCTAEMMNGGHCLIDHLVDLFVGLDGKTR